MPTRRTSSTTVLRHRVFLAISLFMLISHGALFGLTALRADRALDERFEDWAAAHEAAADLLIGETVASMQLTAEMFAQVRAIHRLVRSGRAAVMAEGGGEGGPLAAHHRDALLERVGPAWRLARDRYGVRQLHFHLGPGVLSFLRVHAPTQFGDRMDDLRAVISDAIVEGQPTGGFELGRIYAGLRGVAPIFDQPGVARGAAIGAVEIGVGFDPVLARLRDVAGGDFAVILQGARVDKAVFAENRADAVIDVEGCICVLEATTDLGVRSLLTALPPSFFDPADGPGRRLRRVVADVGTDAARTVELAAWPLMDHIAATRGGDAPGWIVTWRDATPAIAAHRRGLWAAAAVALAAFLALETVIFFAVRQAMRALERRVDEATAALSETNAALIEADAAKSRFLATMSHEIRTPLNGVLGMADLLADEALTAKQARMVAAIRSSGELLMRTISDILDLSKLDAGKVTLESIVFDVATLAREVVDVQQGAAAKKRLRLDLSVVGEATRRRGDPHRVAQILHNLLGNAIKFSDHGAVAVAVDARDADGLALSVADTGVGMTQEQARRIFKAFEQADASTTRQSGGTGLGLSIVRGLVERMGGRVTVDTSPGCGATFTVRLPLPRSTEPAPEAGPAADAVALTGLRALAVDDNEVNRLVLEAMLERLGVRVAMAASGAEAVARFETEGPFDVVLLDIVMPEMDGPETRRRLLAAAARLGRPPPPLIACTARAMPDEIRALRAEGFSDHLPKPIARRALAAALSRAAPAETPARAPEPAAV